MPIEDYEGYVEPDEDGTVETDTAIDPAWELQQKKTFAAWCNSHLRKVNEQIDAIETDFRNGLKLMRLLEVISGEALPKPEKGKMRFHKIANVNKALEFIESKGVKLVSIGAEEIVDGNVKMTLGMLWTIILRFAIQDIQIEDFSAKEGLLLWCQRQTAPYKNVNVTNFHTSFKDGLAFCALIHRFRPDLIEYDSLNKNNPLHNLNYAFDVADHHLDIPKMLDPQDMVNSVKPDERSVMAYVSSYYHVFSGVHKADIATSRICKIVKINQENEKLCEQYQTLSSGILEWIDKKLRDFANREPQKTPAAVEALFQDFRNYRRQEKPTKLEEKAALETTFNTLQTRLRLSNRPPYLPREGQLVSDIANRWKELERLEKIYEDWLLGELQRLERIKYLAKKFDVKCSTHESWSAGIPEALASSDYRSATLAEVRAFQKKDEAFQSDMAAHHGRIDQIQSIASELNKLNYYDMNSINERCEKVVLTWTEMEKLSAQRQHNISEALIGLERIDRLHLDFAKRAAPFNNWMEQAEEDLRDAFIVHTMSEVERLVNAHKTFQSKLKDAEKECVEIKSLASEVDQVATQYKLVNASENPYTNVTAKALFTRWSLIQDLTKQRSEVLQREQDRQTANNKLRRDFADRAEKLNSWLEQHQTEISRIALGGGGSLEDQITQLKKLQAAILQYKTQVDQLEHCNQALHEAYVFENPYTSHTMEALRIAWEHLISSTQHTVNEVENQMLTRDSRGLTAEQIEDVRRCFNHFDRNKTRKLEPNEFKACLVSLGYSFREENKSPRSVDKRQSVIAEIDFTRIMAVVDPNRTGFVTFDAFLDFMTHETADQDTEEQIVESFRTLAGEKGYVTADDIRRGLPPSEAAYCLAHMSRMNGPMGDSGALDFERFAADVYKQRPQY